MAADGAAPAAPASGASVGADDPPLPTAPGVTVATPGPAAPLGPALASARSSDGSPGKREGATSPIVAAYRSRQTALSRAYQLERCRRDASAVTPCHSCSVRAHPITHSDTHGYFSGARVLAVLSAACADVGRVSPHTRPGSTHPSRSECHVRERPHTLPSQRRSLPSCQRCGSVGRPCPG